MKFAIGYHILSYFVLLLSVFTIPKADFFPLFPFTVVVWAALNFLVSYVSQPVTIYEV